MKIKLLFLLVVVLIFAVACDTSASVTVNPDSGEINSTEFIDTPAGAAATLPPDPTATTAAPPTETAEPPPTPTETMAQDGADEEMVEGDQDDAQQEQATGDFPAAEIVNDEGGPVSISGEVDYTNAFFTDGVAEPLIILEDQAGFVDRDYSFLIPVRSQTLGQITSDFFEPPFSFNIALPIEPGGSLRDVDNDGEDDTGVQVFAIAYWTNTWGDPFLEQRDLKGVGWSTAYASTLTSSDAETIREIVGGKLLIYAPDADQGFPSAFGDDGLLFTEDDPIVALPQGYTVVDLDSDPFTFDRSREQVINLIEPEATVQFDYSDLSYADAFDALVDKLEKEYAFTEYKGIDWQQIRADLRPQFEAADEEQDTEQYRRALSELANSIPDGHVSGPTLIQDFQEQTAGGLGIAIRELDDGRTIVNFLAPSSPAEEAGVELGAEIVTLNGLPVSEAISAAEPFSGPFSTEHVKRLQQMRYATRFPLDSEVTITYRNPGSDVEENATLTAVREPNSFSFSSFSSGRDGFELPVEYEKLSDSPYAYAKINSFSDNELLSIQLWERMIQTLNNQNIEGLIIDMRQNLGGSGFLADAMAAYFFDEPHVLGNNGQYAADIDDFYFDPSAEQQFYLPAEELRYGGAVAVLVGPACNSACEFFSYDMTIDDRAAIVGQYPTAGLGGSVDTVRMPDGEVFRFTKGRAVNAEGEIHIEGIGVVPTVDVPINEITLFADEDPVLEAAVAYLNQLLSPEIDDKGTIELGETVEAGFKAETRAQFTLQLSEGDVINILVTSDDFDPVLFILDEDDNLLGAIDNIDEDSTAAGFSDIAIPFDMTMKLQVFGADEDSAGDFTISVAAANE